jgi:hypothetical protein
MRESMNKFRMDMVKSQTKQIIGIAVVCPQILGSDWAYAHSLPKIWAFSNVQPTLINCTMIMIG